MLWPKKNSYKEFDNEKKFLRLENSPPPHNFSNGPSLMYHIFDWFQIMVVRRLTFQLEFTTDLYNRTRDALGEDKQRTLPL